MLFRLISINAFKSNIGIIMGTKEELEDLLKERKELVLIFFNKWSISDCQRRFDSF